jgi:hypothetical protein
VRASDTETPTISADEVGLGRRIGQRVTRPDALVLGDGAPHDLKLPGHRDLLSGRRALNKKDAENRPAPHAQNNGLVYMRSS